jgi:hypothetical protein
VGKLFRSIGFGVRNAPLEGQVPQREVAGKLGVSYDEGLNVP